MNDEWCGKKGANGDEKHEQKKERKKRINIVNVATAHFVFIYVCELSVHNNESNTSEAN